MERQPENAGERAEQGHARSLGRRSRRTSGVGAAAAGSAARRTASAKGSRAAALAKAAASERESAAGSHSVAARTDRAVGVDGELGLVDVGKCRLIGGGLKNHVRSQRRLREVAAHARDAGGA